MISTVVAADEIPWRPAMETVLGILATAGRAQTVLMVRRYTKLSDRIVRDALTDVVHKGLVSRQDGRPAWYRINDHGKRLVERDPKRFGL